MVTNMFVIRLVTLLLAVKGGEEMLNELLREHVQRTQKRIHETTLDAAWEVAEQKRNLTEQI